MTASSVDRCVGTLRNKIEKNRKHIFLSKPFATPDTGSNFSGG
jgi:hypothetical protein